MFGRLESPGSHFSSSRQTSPTTVFSVSTVTKSKVSFETQDSLCYNPLHTSSIQWHRSCITIPKGRRRSRGRKYGPREDRSLSGQTPNPVTLCLISKGLDGSALPALPAATHCSLWGCSTLCIQLSLADIHDSGTTNLLGLRHSPGFIFTASWGGISGLPCRNSPAIYPASVLFPRGGFHNSCTYPCILHDSKAWTTQLMLPSSTACLEWNLAPSVSHICIIFDLLMLFGSRKPFRPLRFINCRII